MVGSTSLRIVRYGVIVQVPYHTGFCPAKHRSFPQNTPAASRPVRKLANALAKLFTTGTALQFEVPSFGFATIVCKTQKGELLWLLAAVTRIFPRIAPKFDAACLLRRNLQTKTIQTVF